MKKLRECPFLILLCITVLMVSGYGIWLESENPEAYAAESGDITTYLTSAGEGEINQSIAAVNAIHTWKEKRAGLDSMTASIAVSAKPVQEMEADSQKPSSTPAFTAPAVSADKVSENKKPSSGASANEIVEAVSENKPVYDDEREFQTVSDNYFDDALFIGDSRTEGFHLYSGLENITVFAHSGFQVYTAFDRKLIQMGEYKLTVPEAMELNQDKYKKVYMMFGLNEMGWGNDDLFAQSYYYLIDAAKQSEPNAVIYIQGIIHISKAENDRQSIFKNEAIDKRNELLKKIAKDEHAVFIDLNEVFTDEEGNLPEGYSADGIHLKAPYIEIWKEYLKEHAIVR